MGYKRLRRCKYYIHCRKSGRIWVRSLINRIVSELLFWFW